jgi:hypothetical protein
LAGVGLFELRNSNGKTLPIEGAGAAEGNRRLIPALSEWYSYVVPGQAMENEGPRDAGQVPSGDPDFASRSSRMWRVNSRSTAERFDGAY